MTEQTGLICFYVTGTWRILFLGKSRFDRKWGPLKQTGYNFDSKTSRFQFSSCFYRLPVICGRQLLHKRGFFFLELLKTIWKFHLRFRNHCKTHSRSKLKILSSCILSLRICLSCPSKGFLEVYAFNDR